MKRKNVLIIGFVTLVIGLIISLVFYPKNWIGTEEGTSKEYVTPNTGINDPSHPDYDKIVDGVHLRTGFIDGEGLQLVINNCTTCHSAKLVTQNKMSKEQWKSTIRWMQETQNLWDLGVNEQPIVNYLATHYSPTEKGRRQNLTDIEWYELEQQ